MRYVVKVYQPTELDREDAENASVAEYARIIKREGLTAMGQPEVHDFTDDDTPPWLRMYAVIGEVRPGLGVVHDQG